ncbi:Protein of unknown function [Cotesia congregata]|uniref:Uncharacterized protein n=1 Tax=Cotesia congregata TaxID=51543 RepID=A0A8J2HB67_COTCN|nr:Protein of unknown function [Cotesia congregata]
MQRGGRPKHSFWEEGGFKSIRQNGKQVASCLRCSKIINNTAEQRLKSHRKTCIWEVENSNIDDSSDDSVVRHLSLKLKNRSGSYEENNNCTTTCNTDGVITLSTVKLKKNTPKINSFIDKISETEHSKLDEALSYFFFTALSIDIYAQAVADWARENDLEINYKKTKVMILGSKHKLKLLENFELPEIIIDGNVIPYTNSTKHLGVHLSNNLSWNMHISQVSRKVYGSLNSEPKFLRDLFIEEDPVIRRSQRIANRNNNITFKIINFVTTTYEHSFVMSAIRFWQDLPPEISNSLGLESFKTRVFDFLINLE